MDQESDAVLDLLRRRRSQNRYAAALNQSEQPIKQSGGIYLGKDADRGVGLIRNSSGGIVPAQINTSGLLKPGQAVRVSQAGGMVAIDHKPRVKKQRQSIQSISTSGPSIMLAVQVVNAVYIAGHQASPVFACEIPEGEYLAGAVVDNLGNGDWTLNLCFGDATTYSRWRFEQIDSSGQTLWSYAPTFVFGNLVDFNRAKRLVWPLFSYTQPTCFGYGFWAFGRTVSSAYQPSQAQYSGALYYFNPFSYGPGLTVNRSESGSETNQLVSLYQGAAQTMVAVSSFSNQSYTFIDANAYPGYEYEETRGSENSSFGFDFPVLPGSNYHHKFSSNYSSTNTGVGGRSDLPFSRSSHSARSISWLKLIKVNSDATKGLAYMGSGALQNNGSGDTGSTAYSLVIYSKEGVTHLHDSAVGVYDEDGYGMSGDPFNKFRDDNGFIDVFDTAFTRIAYNDIMGGGSYGSEIKVPYYLWNESREVLVEQYPFASIANIEPETIAVKVFTPTGLEFSPSIIWGVRSVSYHE